MIYPEADKLEDWGSKYALVALAAKRAKQIKAGAPILVDTQSRNPLTIALEEIAAGRITCWVNDQDIVISTSVEPEVAELLAIPMETEEETEEAVAEAPSEEAVVGDEHAEEEEEYVEEEEEEEDGHPLGADDVWKEVLGADTEEDSGIGSHIVVDPDADEVETIAAEPEQKPKRGRKRSAKATADPLEEGPNVEAAKEQPEDE